MATKAGHNTGIEWTHVPGYTGETWNPVRGCTKISPGCKHCYAETFAERWRGIADHPYEQGFDLRLVPEKLDEPLRASKPRAYFVNSMSDLHQEGVPLDFLRSTYAVMCAAQRHLFMILTKRADRMRDAVFALGRESVKDSRPLPIDNNGTRLRPPFLHGDRLEAVTPPNVWLGVSVEDRKYGLPRVDILRDIPAAVRFLSVEPLLEDLGNIDLTGIHWVIVGGESGANARPMEESWALNIMRQCAKQGVPFFFKQWGGINKRARGNILDGRQHLAFPKVVQPCA